MIADALRRVAGLRLKDEDGNAKILALQPPATEDEICDLEMRLQCALPADIREALRVSRGFANGHSESFSLLHHEALGLEELLPHAYPIAYDGFGNYWVLDLVPGATRSGPVFYVCHDPAVLVYQSPTIEAFLNETITLLQGGPRSPIDAVHDDIVHRIWRENPFETTAAALHASNDEAVRAFALSLPPSALVVDLRDAAFGQGFSWGRFGPNTIVRRAGDARVWALMPPERRAGLFARLFK